MTDYTVKEIEEAVEAHEEPGAFWSEIAFWSGGTKLKLRNEDIHARYIDGNRPREGAGEDVDAVIKVGTQMFMKEGYYASHYGTDWDGPLSEVRPVEKLITVYESI